MTRSYVVPKHRRGQWWPIVFSLYEGGCKCYNMLPDWSWHICWCCTSISVTCLCIDILTVFFVILYFIEVYFDIIVLVTSLFVFDCDCLNVLPSDPSFCYTFLWWLCGSIIRVCSALARLVLYTYVVPRLWHGQWWPVGLSSERAIMTVCITVWKCGCSSVFHRMPLILSYCQ